MLIKPNASVLEGTVRSVRPEADGWGAEVELTVRRNLTPVTGTDLLRPTPGESLRAFFADPEAVKVGDEVRVEASLVADEHGGRNVIRSLEPARG